MRTSTVGQEFDAWLAALRFTGVKGGIGCSPTRFRNTVKADRPEPVAMLAYARAADTVVVTAMAWTAPSPKSPVPLQNVKSTNPVAPVTWRN